MTHSSGKELWLAAFACFFAAAAYAGIVFLTRQTPAASGFYGHALGILGFVLMLITETLYSLRKRIRTAQWGRMADWLQFHIFTGIVGPFLVLLHSSWKFNGLAGATTLLTAIIVLSGFVGRYIYTLVPRTADGLEEQSFTGQMQVAALANARRLLALWHTSHIPIGAALFTAAAAHIWGALYYATLLR